MTEHAVIVAMDFSSKEEVYGFLGKLGGERPYLKIGMELFYKEAARYSEHRI